MIDDLRPELGCYGKKHISSPEIDRLAKTGQLFARAYANYPLCGPSRATLLSGLYPSSSRFTVWNCSLDDDVKGLVSLPMHFKNNHYKTLSLGKVFNNLEDGNGSWDELWRPVVNSPEIIAWEYLSKGGREVFEQVNQGRALDTRLRNSHQLPKMGPAFEAPDVGDDAYVDGRLSFKAVEKLQELRLKPEQPFFLSVGFHKPHSPFNAPKRYWDLYDREKIQLPANPHPAQGVPDHMKVDQAGVRSYHGIPPTGTFSDSLSRELLHGYYACVSFVDRQVGRILNALEHYGLAENTIVILCGDQGHQLGEHGLWDKVKSYSTSLQVPLIVRVPGKAKNVTQMELTSLIDLYPTLCELAGISKPFHLQGRSLVPTLTNPGVLSNDAAFCRSHRNAETIYTQTHSYTEFFGNDGKREGRVLFDLATDPNENYNVSEKAENQAIVSELSNRLRKHLESRDIIQLRK
jgi:iduronate 2-sulfatase